jgi:hypothetical protein
MNIDRAETPEQIINALRGNEAPMEQRYAELAQFVGEADAQRTPESVLALVQPTIMMTEQGAMDSGIGELMQGLTGEIEMETAEGAPTAMGQGVGSLMMAGANAAPGMGVGQPPVANFRQGGVVQRFQAGGEASRLQQLYSEMLPTYQSILGDGGEQRRLTQAQILFDIADRAGAFAAGVDPRTGQSIARLSPAAQLAAATSGLGGQIGERLGSQEEQDRALRLAALQAAQGEFSAERAAARAAAAAGRDRGVGTFYDLRDSEGNLVRRVPVSNRGELDRLIAEAAEIGGDFRPSQFEATGLTDEDYFTKFGMTRAEFGALPVEDQRRLQGLAPELGADVKGIPRDVFDRSPENQQRVILGDTSPGAVNGIPRDIFNTLSQADQQKILGTAPEAARDVKGIPAAVFSTLSPENQQRVILGDTSPGSVNGIPRDIFNTLSQADQQKILGTAPEAAPDVKGIPAAVFSTLSPEDQRRVILGDTSPGSVNGIPRDIFNTLSPADQQKILGTAPEAAPDIKGIPAAVFSTLSPEDQRRVLVGDTSPGSVNGIPRDIFNTLSPADQQKILGTAPETAADVKGIPRDVFNTLSAEDQRRVLVGDTSPGAVNGIPRDIFNTLSPADQQKILGTAQEAPSGEFIKIRMPDGTEETVRSDSPEADRLTALGGQRVAITAAPTEDLLTNPDIMDAYAAGTLDRDRTLQVQAQIAEQSRMVFNPETGENERRLLTPVVLQSEEARRARGDTTAITFAEEGEPAASLDEGLARLEQFGGAAFGTATFVRNLGNKVAAFFDANAPFPVQQEGINAVTALNEAAKLAYRDMTEGRPAQDAVDQFAANFPVPARISGSPDTAASEIRAQIDIWNREMAQSEEALRSGILSPSQRATVQAGLVASRDMIRSYEAVLQGIERRGSGGTGTVDPAQFRK